MCWAFSAQEAVGQIVLQTMNKLFLMACKLHNTPQLLKEGRDPSYFL